MGTCIYIFLTGSTTNVLVFLAPLFSMMCSSNETFKNANKTYEFNSVFLTNSSLNELLKAVSSIKKYKYVIRNVPHPQVFAHGYLAFWSHYSL